MENPVQQPLPQNSSPQASPPLPAPQPSPEPQPVNQSSISREAAVSSSQPPQKSGAIKLVLGLLLLAAVGAGSFYMGAMKGSLTLPGSASPSAPNPEENSVACTMDAKICPDGTAVGRVGPNCEFAACPQNTEPSAPLTLDNSYTNNSYGYSLRYPDRWKVTTEDYVTLAAPDARMVYIFNPEDRPEETFYSGMIIEYVGMLQNLPEGGFKNVNGTEMITQETPHGNVYYALIPGTDQLLMISGADGNTSNEVTNEGLQAIFESFRFKEF